MALTHVWFMSDFKYSSACRDAINNAKRVFVGGPVVSPFVAASQADQRHRKQESGYDEDKAGTLRLCVVGQIICRLSVSTHLTFN